MAEDPELAAIRSQRLAQMQGAGGNEQAKKQQEALKQQEEAKNGMLSQILDQSARARLNSIALVKPEKAKAIENMLIQMARCGQLQGKLSEQPLISLIEKVNSQIEGQKPKVTIERRRYAMDSDDED